MNRSSATSSHGPQDALSSRPWGDSPAVAIGPDLDKSPVETSEVEGSILSMGEEYEEETSTLEDGYVFPEGEYTL